MVAASVVVTRVVVVSGSYMPSTSVRSSASSGVPGPRGPQLALDNYRQLAIAAEGGAQVPPSFSG